VDNIPQFGSLAGKKFFRKSDLALAEERKPAIDSYIKDLIKLPPNISQSSVVVSFFLRRQSDPEIWIQQFPLKINRSSEHGNNFESKTEDIKEDFHEAHRTFKDEPDNELESYMNPTFEASWPGEGTQQMIGYREVRSGCLNPHTLFTARMD